MGKYRYQIEIYHKYTFIAGIMTILLSFSYQTSMLLKLWHELKSLLEDRFLGATPRYSNSEGLQGKEEGRGMKECF